METKTFDYKKMRSEIALNCGVELDETSLAILHIFLLNQTGLSEAQNKKIDEAAKGINQSKKSLEASRDEPKAQAFWFGFGIFGTATCFLILCTCFCVFYWENIKKQQLLMPEQMKWYQSYYDNFKNIDPKNTKVFLQVYPLPNP